MGANLIAFRAFRNREILTRARGRRKVSSRPGAELGFTVTSERDPWCYEHVTSYIFHVPYALFQMLHANATILPPNRRQRRTPELMVSQEEDE